MQFFFSFYPGLSADHVLFGYTWNSMRDDDDDDALVCTLPGECSASLQALHALNS